MFCRHLPAHLLITNLLHMRLLYVLVLAFCFPLIVPAQQNRIIPGLPLDTFVKMYPSLRQYEEKNRIQIYRDENLYGLDGSWLFQFEKDSLAWFCYSFFTFKEKDLSSQNFSLCRNAALQFIHDRSSTSGKPAFLKNSKKRFTKLCKVNKNFTVVNAVWETAEMNFNIAFKYLEPSRGRPAYLSVEMYFYGPKHKLL